MTTPLNYLTARPTLELLLALAGLEAPTVGPGQALPIFGDLLALPQDQGCTDAGYQAEVVVEGPDAGLLVVRLGLRYAVPGPLLDPTQARLCRSVGIHWSYPLPDADTFSSCELWLTDFPDFAAFSRAIQDTAEWKFADATGTLDCDVFGDDD